MTLWAAENERSDTLPRPYIVGRKDQQLGRKSPTDKRISSNAESRKVLHVGDIEVDLDRRKLTHGEREIRLTPAEHRQIAVAANLAGLPISAWIRLNLCEKVEKTRVK